MNFQQKYPDFAAIENQVMAARVERAIYLSTAIVNGINWVVASGKRLVTAVNRSVEAEISHLLVHGLLHLLGHDHEEGEAESEAMQAREDELLDALGFGGRYAHGH